MDVGGGGATAAAPPPAALSCGQQGDAAEAQAAGADAEARVRAVRHWALSLKPGMDAERRFDDIKLVLPPLPKIKEYVPGSASSRSRGARGGGAASPPGSPPPLSGRSGRSAWTGISSEEAEEPERFEPPIYSTLGVSKSRWMPEAHAGAGVGLSAELAAAVAAAKRAAFAVRPQRLRAKAAVAPALSLQPALPPRRCPPPILRTCTVSRPEGRPVVRGADPMVGGLFSRDINLDPVAERRGIYEAQLRNGMLARRAL